MPIKIILDSNFLMSQIQFRIDIFQELEKILNQKIHPIIPISVFEEIEKITKSNDRKQSKNAKIMLDILKGVEILRVEKKYGETTDELILRLASEISCLVATNDKKLRLILKKAGIPVVFLRQKSHLQVENFI